MGKRFSIADFDIELSVAVAMLFGGGGLYLYSEKINRFLLELDGEYFLSLRGDSDTILFNIVFNIGVGCKYLCGYSLLFWCAVAVISVPVYLICFSSNKDQPLSE
jgi:hypothetical protein